MSRGELIDTLIPSSMSLRRIQAQTTDKCSYYIILGKVIFKDMKIKRV